MTPPNSLSATYLYRIVSFDRAAEIITSGTLYFAHPSTWDDPYESTLKHKTAHAIFAQCWCRKALSDAMWRIYSPHGLGVRIGTTRQRLQRALAEAKEHTDINFRIKNVKYLYQNELDEELLKARRNLATNDTFQNATEPLFLKRKAFDHEREARVVVLDSDCHTNNQKTGITVKVKPFEVLTSIWIDPRAPAEVVNAYRYYLKDKLKFPGTVDRSHLYDAPDEVSVQREA